MKILWFRRLFFLISCSIFFNAAVSAQEQTLTLAYLENGLADLKDSEMQIALQLLAKELTQDSDVNMSIKAVPTLPEMFALIKSGKVNYTIINSFNYIMEKDQLSPYLDATMWAIQRSQKAQEDYVLVVRKETPYKDIGSLSGKRLSLHQDYLLMKLYLQFIVKKNSHLSLEKFFKSVKNTRTASQTVLDVYFSTSDVCIVPQHILDLVAELNPDINNKLKVVHHSGEQFIPALVLSFKGIPENINTIVAHNTEQINRTLRGQQILNMFHIQSLVKTSVNQLDYMIDMYNEYKSMKPSNKQ